MSNKFEKAKADYARFLKTSVLSAVAVLCYAVPEPVMAGGMSSVHLESTVSYEARNWQSFNLAHAGMASAQAEPADAFASKPIERADQGAGQAQGKVMGPVDEAPALAPVDPNARIRRQVRKLQVVFQVLNAMDAVQTIVLTSGKCREANPIYGRDPSVGKILAIKVASGLIHQIVSNRMLARNPRAARTFERISIAVQGGTVLWNFSMAI